MSKHVTVRVKEKTALAITREEVDSAIRKHSRRCRCCNQKQESTKEKRVLVSFRIDSDLYNVFKNLGNPYKRIARIIEYEEGYCPVCGG